MPHEDHSLFDLLPPINQLGAMLREYNATGSGSFQSLPSLKHQFVGRKAPQPEAK
jgi:hypothetical protein